MNNVGNRWFPRHPNLKRMANSYPEGSTLTDDGTELGLGGGLPDEFAQSQRSEFKTEMWGMGCPE